MRKKEVKSIFENGDKMCGRKNTAYYNQNTLQGGTCLKQDIICLLPLDAQTLSDAVAEFLRTVRPERQRLFEYYRGEQSVPRARRCVADPTICFALRFRATSLRCIRDTF